MKTFGLILVLALAACQQAEPEPADPVEATPTAVVTDPAADRAVIEAMTADYQAADRAGDHAAIAALYADDAVIHPANLPAAHGREALDAYFAANDSEPQDITFTTGDVVVSDAGDMAYEVGT
ncbi:MAG: YybH family protein, partial [Longimicrobiaceae bacterium]